MNPIYTYTIFCDDWIKKNASGVIKHGNKIIRWTPSNFPTKNFQKKMRISRYQSRSGSSKSMTPLTWHCIFITALIFHFTVIFNGIISPITNGYIVYTHIYIYNICIYIMIPKTYNIWYGMIIPVRLRLYECCISSWKTPIYMSVHIYI